jgi:type IV pilus assembly protein PilQ
MLVKDGDTVVIGGIYETRKGVTWRKVPWLAEIPILGYLFKYNRRTTDRTEVLVFISPKIVTQSRVAASR